MTTDYTQLMLAQLAPQFATSFKPRDPYSARRAFGLNVLQQGTSGKPVSGPVEGIARALQAGLGGYLVNQTNEAQDTEEQGRSSALAAALQKVDKDGQPDIGAITSALTGIRGLEGQAAMLRVASALQARQDAQSRATAGMITGQGQPPGGGAFPGGPPPATSAAPPAAGGAAPQAGGVFDVPEQYAPLVAAAAKKYGVDPRLLASTGWNESRWQPNAVAIGDQPTINPATGRRYDGRGLMGWGDNIAAARGFNAADPAASIEHTAAVYREYTDKYGGNPLLARLAYGWGPGNVDKWLQAGGDPNKIPDGAKVWLPRTAYGIADEQQARAAFPQIAPLLRPGVQFNYGGQPQAAQPPVAGAPQVAQAPAATPVANPPQAAGPIPMQMPAPQMAAGQPQGGGVPDDSGEGRPNPGFGVPTTTLPPPVRFDDGSREMAIYQRWIQAGAPTAQQDMALKFYQIAEQKKAAAQQAQVDAAGKTPPIMARTDDGSVAMVNGALDALKAQARAKAQGGGEVEYFERGGQRYQRNLATGEEKPAPQADQYVPATQNGAVGQRNQADAKFYPGPSGDKLREVDQGAREALAVTARYLDVFKDRDAIAAYLNNPRSPDAQRVNQAFENLKIIMRSPALMNTGVLQPAEARMIEDTLLSPTSIRGLIATPDAMAAKIDELQRLIRTRHAAAFQSAGVSAPDIGAPGAAAPADKPPQDGAVERWERGPDGKLRRAP